MMDIRAAIVISVLAAMFGAAIGYSSALIDSGVMRQECEKDLARNLKCEMVYVKPEGD